MQNQMIPLTVANTLDQTQKQRVEVPQNATLKQAVQEMKLAPKGQFDIYDAMGSVISNNNAAAHRDSTIYVGVAKVAGGAGIEFDDDWDEGIDLLEVQNKQAFTTLIRQDGTRHKIIPQPGETMVQVMERAGLDSLDGQPMEVRDNHKEVVSNNLATDMIGRSFFVVPQRIRGGASGIPRERLVELKVEYPSLRPVRIHTNATHTSMISLQFPSKGKTSNGFWQIAIHCPNAPSGLPHTYVLNHDKITQRPRVSIFSGNPPNVSYGTGSSRTLPGTNKPGYWVCHGQILPHLNQIGNDPIRRIGAYINHIQNLLNA